MVNTLLRRGWYILEPRNHCLNYFEEISGMAVEIYGGPAVANDFGGNVGQASGCVTVIRPH